MAGDDRWWCYLPDRPDLRRDTEGAPQLTAVDAGASAYLLLTATWDAPAADLEALRQEVALRIAEPSPARIRLTFAPVSEPRCAVLVGDGAGSFETVATSATSGVPPYDAVFSLALSGDQLVAGRGAREGRTGLLAVEYVAGLPATVTGHATLTAATGPLTTWLRAHEHEQDLIDLLEEAVRQGLAAVTVEAPDPHVGELATTLYDRVLAEAARALPNWLDHQVPGDLRVSVTLEQQAEEPVRAFADIGSIVAGASTRAAPGGPHAAD